MTREFELTETGEGFDNLVKYITKLTGQSDETEVSLKARDLKAIIEVAKVQAANRRQEPKEPVREPDTRQTESMHMPSTHRTIKLNKRVPVQRKTNPLFSKGAAERVIQSERLEDIDALQGDNLLSGRKLASLLGYENGDKSIRDKASRHELLYVLRGVNSVKKYPAAQIFAKRLLPGLTKILARFGFDGTNGAEITDFLVTRNEGLENWTPRDYLIEFGKDGVSHVLDCVDTRRNAKHGSGTPGENVVEKEFETHAGHV